VKKNTATNAMSKQTNLDIIKVSVDKYQLVSTYPVPDALAVVIYLLVEQFKQSWWIELEVLNTWLFGRPWSLYICSRHRACM